MFPCAIAHVSIKQKREKLTGSARFSSVLPSLQASIVLAAAREIQKN
jgi:hypothetical protein